MLETLKRKVGLEEEPDENFMECQSCGERFTTVSDPDSIWSRCPECESTETERVAT